VGGQNQRQLEAGEAMRTGKKGSSSPTPAGVAFAQAHQEGTAGLHGSFLVLQRANSSPGAGCGAIKIASQTRQQAAQISEADAAEHHSASS
jgi:hypothetical protein